MAMNPSPDGRPPVDAARGNGKITREIAYEISREWGGPLDNDEIPEDAITTDYPDGPDYGTWK